MQENITDILWTVEEEPDHPSTVKSPPVGHRPASRSIHPPSKPSKGNPDIHQALRTRYHRRPCNNLGARRLAIKAMQRREGLPQGVPPSTVCDDVRQSRRCRQDDGSVGSKYERNRIEYVERDGEPKSPRSSAIIDAYRPCIHVQLRSSKTANKSYAATRRSSTRSSSLRRALDGVRRSTPIMDETTARSRYEQNTQNENENQSHHDSGKDLGVNSSS